MSRRETPDRFRVKRILILKPGSLGDVVHALPVASALRAAMPDAHIDWVIDPRWAPLLEENPAIGGRILFPREKFRGMGGWLAAVAWLRGLRRCRSDICLDLQGLLRSGLMAWASGARQRIGLSDAREGARLFYSESVKVHSGEHSVRRYLRILEPLGIAAPEIPQFPLPVGQLPSPAPPSPYILIHPFARGRGKSLTGEVLAAMCHALAPFPIVLAGSRGTEPLPELPARNLLGETSLVELIGLIRSAAVMISVDSGPAHIAAAVGTTLVAIHTWSHPGLVGPFSESAWIWRSGSISRQTLAVSSSFLPEGSPPGVSDALRIAEHARTLLAQK